MKVEMNCKVWRGVNGRESMIACKYLFTELSQDLEDEMYRRLEAFTKKSGEVGFTQSAREAAKAICYAVAGMKLTVGIKVTAVVGRAVVFTFVTTDETGREIANMGEVSMTAGETATVGPLDKGLTMTWKVE